MRSTSFAVVVLGCAVSFVSATTTPLTQDCSTQASDVTAATADSTCGGFADVDGATAAVELSSLACGKNSVTGEDWFDVFATCVNEISEYTVNQSDQTSMCACYKKFVKYGFDNECQEPPLLRALAIKGFRFGVGQPLFGEKLTITGAAGSTQPTCALANLDSSTGVYTGQGSILTQPVGNPATLGAGQGCIQACSTICPYEDCAPASSITMGGAAMAMVFAAVASLMQ